MNVTIFCGSQPDAHDYEEAYRLGKLLGAAGHTVLTGGYIGGMEAVSRGAVEAGGHTIGITCEEIEKWRPVAPNPWVKEERRFACLRDRLFALIESSEAAIALPGGAGTLTEIAMTWNHLLTESIRPRPLILVGTGWEATFKALFENLGGYIPVNQRRWLLFAKDIDEAIKLL